MEDLQGVKALLREELVGLGRRAPPVVVVALEDELLSRKLVHEAEIRLRLPDAHSPAQIAAEQRQILRPHARKAFFQFFRVIPPLLPKDVHGLVAAQGEVQIADCK